MNENSIEKTRFIEGLAANAWRPAIEQQLDGWRMRSSGGSSSRVNSVWPNQLTGALSLAERISLVEEFYSRHQQPACFQMCPAALPGKLAGELKARGYAEIKHTSVKIASAEVVISKSNSPNNELIENSILTEEWFQAYTTASNYNLKSLPIRRGILNRIGPAANFVLLKSEGLPASVGLGIVERGWMGVFCVVTFPSYRRKNFASEIMNRLSTWGMEAGASQIYLQVMENNPPALAMYQKLGFEKLYEYWYSQKDLQK